MFVLQRETLILGKFDDTSTLNFVSLVGLNDVL